MFSYIDPSVRRHLVDNGQLFQLDRGGVRLDADATGAPGEVRLNVLGPVPLPLDVAGEEHVFDWYTFVRRAELAHTEALAEAVRNRSEPNRLMPLLSTYMAVNSALVYGDVRGGERPLVRVHSCCMTGDVFGSERCECGPQLQTALRRIVADPEGGALIYMAGHEGRGIGLWAKAITYLLQDDGQDTYEANRSLGLPDDSRDFSDAAAMIAYLLEGDRPFRLMSNNPKKHADLRANGLTAFDIEKHVAGVGRYNRRYLSAKRTWGHVIDETDLEPRE